MPKVTIPLILPSTARGWATSIGTSAKDQQLINGVYRVSRNSLAGSRAVYIHKRAGSTTDVTYATSPEIIKQYTEGLTLVWANGSLYKRSDPNTSTNLGAVPNGPYGPSNRYFCNAIISGNTVFAFSNESDGWYLYTDSYSNNFPTFQADTHSNTTIDNIGGTGAATTGIYVGQSVSGTGIPANTRVATVSANSFTITNAATGTATITVTKEAVAKITDAQFPSTVTTMEFLDSYFFAGTAGGTIYQSAANDPSSWDSGDTINADYEGDGSEFIFKHQNYIVSAGLGGTIQYFYNAGNASGSVLSPAEHLTVVGLILLNRPIPMAGASYCLATINDKNFADGMGLYRLTGVNNYERVSDDYWSSVIADNFSTGRIGTATTGNKQLVIVTNDGGSSVSVCYDPVANEFSLIQLASGSLLSSFANYFTKASVDTSFSWQAGNTWTDSSSAYTLTAQTEPKSLNKGQSFIIRSVDLVADTEASGTATLYVSRDDYATWESVGTFDMTAQIKRIHALGWFPSTAAFKVEHSANTNFRAQALIADLELCSR